MANPSFPSQSARKEVSMWSGMQALLDEGALYYAGSVFGTPLTQTTSVVDAGNSGATSAQTRPVAIIYNAASNSDPNARTAYPLTMNLILTVASGQAPTSATEWRVGGWLEPVGASAYTSGGTQYTARALNPTGRASGCSVYFGPITAAATTSGGYQVFQREMLGAIPVLGDDYTLTFGDFGASMTSGNTTASVPRKTTVPLPAIAIPPGYALKIGMWGTSNAAASKWDMDLVWAERIAGQ